MVAADTAPLPAPASRWRVGPPGVLFYLATGVSILIALDANSRDSLGTLLLAAVLWLGVAGVWLGRFLVAAHRTGLRMPASHWVRWLVIPLVMALVFAVTRTEVVKDARLALSRDAMDAMAADVMAGGSTERGWVGLYNVGDVQRTANGVRFVLDESLSRWGFAYAADGEPDFIADEDEDAGLWTGPWFESAGGGWWRWREGWD